MEEFEWPSCSDLSFGEDLSNSSLSFHKNEYGIFFWEDEKVCPPVKNSGVHVVFASLSVTFSPSLDDETVTGWLYAKSISMFCPFSVRTILFSSSGLITSSPKTFTTQIAVQTATLDS